MAALDRTNMVSLLDIGLLGSTKTSNIVKLGKGFTELTEDWAPNVESSQYVDEKNKSSNLKGYEFSMTPEREYISDEVQTVIDHMSKTLPIGVDCETYYYRFYKTDLTTGVGDCIKVPVIAAFSSVGGAGGDTLTSTIELKGNGDPELGTITISESGYSWAPKSAV